MKEWFKTHQNSILPIGLLLLGFLIGLALPSPFFRHEVEEPLVEETPEDFIDTTNMAIEGGLYTGSITKADLKRNGYGQFKTHAGTDNESVYEGEWKEDLLKYGKKRRVTMSTKDASMLNWIWTALELSNIARRIWMGRVSKVCWIPILLPRISATGAKTPNKAWAVRL